MSFRSTLLALGLLAALGATRSTAQAQESPESIPAPRTADELIERFRTAHQKHSIAEVARLIYRGGVGEFEQRITESQIADDFPLTISRVTIRLLTADELPRYRNDARDYRQPIPATRRMTVEFLPGSSASGAVTVRSYLVGVKRGTFYLVSTVAPRG